MLRKLGRFELLKKIATGGMAEIHVAKMEGVEGFEKLVVIKLLLKDLAEDKQFVEMFLNEARLASRLNHPNVVQIYDLGVSDGVYYIAMEFIHGESLYSLAKTCRKQKKLVPLRYTLRVASQVCEGLQYAHMKIDSRGNRMNIVHCDISPQNILVSFEGLVKIVDFGIAKAATVFEEKRTGQIKGKLIYLSPEQVMGRPLDGRSDIFSVGIVLWELVTGRRLFYRKDKTETFKAILQEPAPAPREINQHVPEELEYIILKALEKNPGDRFQDAMEMAKALEAFAQRSGASASTFDLRDFMHSMYPDQQELLQKIDEMRSTGQNLESLLFDDIPLDAQAFSGEMSGEISAEISGISSSLFTPSKPIDDLQPKKDSKVYFRPMDQKRKILPLVLVVLILAALGAAGYLFYPKIAAMWKAQPESPPPPVNEPVKTPKEPVRPKGVASFHVTSEPEGAKVFLNGAKVGITPVDVPDIITGSFHEVRVALKGYKPFARRVRPDKAGEVLEVHAKLSRWIAEKWGSVVVTTTPKGASVLLDDEVITGVTPLTIKKVAAGQKHRLEATLEGHKDWIYEFKVRPGETHHLKGVLASVDGKGMARLSIDSKPEAIVFLGTKKLGSTPLVDQEIPTGKHKVRLHCPSIQSSEYLILDAKSGDSIQKNIEFRKGTLKIDSKPAAEIFHHGKKLGSTPLVKQLYVGKYKLVLKNAGLNLSHTRQVDIVAGKVSTVSVELQ